MTERIKFPKGGPAVLQIKLEPKMLELFKKACQEQGKSMSEVLRELIKKYIDDHITK